LDELQSDHISPQEVGTTALVCVQHLTESTGSLIERFIEIGFMPTQIHILGKIYSSKPLVQERLRSLGVNVYRSSNNFEWGLYSCRLAKDIDLMWQAAISTGSLNSVKRVIVLDDGGAAIAAVPVDLLRSKVVIGVEQTMSGIVLNRNERPLIPFIGIGASAAKLLIEPMIIRESLLRQAVERSVHVSGPAGVVGVGYIGSAITEELQRTGVEVYTYDNRPRRKAIIGARPCESLNDLYSAAKTIWGCTGTNHLADFKWTECIRMEKTLISCSSRDSEFNSALRELNSKPQFDKVCRLSDVIVEADSSAPVTVLYGGFPINFSGVFEAELAKDIQVTRALLFSGVLQALKGKADAQSGSEIPLDAQRQAQIVSHWLDMYPERRSWYQDDIINIFTDESLIERHQKG
jgi:S-adenosylhomocysteine hydrolase